MTQSVRSVKITLFLDSLVYGSRLKWISPLAEKSLNVLSEAHVQKAEEFFNKEREKSIRCVGNGPKNIMDRKGTYKFTRNTLKK